MISKLSLVEIQQVLTENVEIGDPNSKGLPNVLVDTLEENKPRLYGTFTNSDFALTFNSSKDICPYFLKGNLIYKGQTQTEVNYSVKVMRAPKILFIIIFIIVHLWAYLMISEEKIFIIFTSIIYFTFWFILIMNIKKSNEKLRELEDYFKKLVQIKS